MTVLITLGCVVAAIVIFAVGFNTGYNACETNERKMEEQRRIGAAMEHWHGHTTHKGGTILSPVRVAGGIQ
jgi:hypothetical protein